MALCHVTIKSCMLFEIPCFISLDSFYNYSILDVLRTVFYRKILRSYSLFYSQVFYRRCKTIHYLLHTVITLQAILLLDSVLCWRLLTRFLINWPQLPKRECNRILPEDFTNSCRIFTYCFCSFHPLFFSAAQN